MINLELHHLEKRIGKFKTYHNHNNSGNDPNFNNHILILVCLITLYLIARLIISL